MPGHTLRALAALSISAAGLAVTTTPAAALTNYTVTTTEDVVAGDGLFSLREAMIEANADGDHSTITLGAGLTYDLDLCQMKEPFDNGTGNFHAPDDDDANLDGDLDHGASHNLTIYGNGSTINQTCSYDRVIHSTHRDTHLVIDNAIIQGGDDAPELGDNIRANGSITLQNETVVRDGAPFDGSGFSVFTTDDTGDQDAFPTLTIDDSTITANDETGAAVEFGTLMVTNSTVTNNEGDGVRATHSEATVVGSTITGNLITGIEGTDSSVEVIDSTVSNNGQGASATANFPDLSPMVVTNSTIDGNERGGLNCGYCQSVTVTDSAITGNGTLDGPLGTFGGITMFSYDVNDGVFVTGSVIAGNRSPKDGGAISATFVTGGGTADELPLVRVDDSDIFNNRSGIQSHGGALYVDRGNVAIVNLSSFYDNRAKPNNQLAGGDGGALWVDEATTVEIQDSYLTNNQAHYSGGTIRANRVENLSIERSLVSDGQALGGGGGGLKLTNVADIRVTDSSIINNQAEQAGGGVDMSSPRGQTYSADFQGSTVTGNAVVNGITGGGGIFASGELAELRMINSTVARNSAFGAGGGVEVLGRGAVNLIHTTMVYNESTSGDVANLYHQSGPLISWATVIAGGAGGGFDCGTFDGPINSVGHSISGANSCGFVGPTDKTGVVAFGLGPLADNGGPTATFLPAKSSPLVNVIPLDECPNPVDQRGVARPVGARCDVGSVEVAGQGAGPDDFKNPGHDDRKPSDTLTQSGR